MESPDKGSGKHHNGSSDKDVEIMRRIRSLEQERDDLFDENKRLRGTSWMGDHLDQIAFYLLLAFALFVLSFWLLRWMGVVGEFDFHKSLYIILAAVVSFFIVANLRQRADPVEFSGFGLKFKGNAGRPVLWIFCFLILITTMYLSGFL